MSDSHDSPLQFPCAFPIKIMGAASMEFEAMVISIVREHCPDLGEGAVRTQPSRAGNYVSITATVNATSQQHLDDLYRALTSAEGVKMVL